jgi:hypothetical protein
VVRLTDTRFDWGPIKATDPMLARKGRTLLRFSRSTIESVSAA